MKGDNYRDTDRILHRSRIQNDHLILQNRNSTGGGCRRIITRILPAPRIGNRIVLQHDCQVDRDFGR
jgi:hypothetical protein